MRWFYYLFFVFVFISLAYSMLFAVTLISPLNLAINTTSDDLIFRCSGVGENLVNITFYSNITNSNGEFIAIETKNYNTADVVVEFNVNNVNNHTYIWNCLLTNQSNNRVFATNNYTLTVNFPKIGFSGTLPNQIIDEDSNLTNAINLSKYFSNANYYTFSGNNHINLIIFGGNVSFYPEYDWNGTEIITFSGVENISQVSSSISSNSIIVSVVGINDAPVFVGNISNQSWGKNTNKTLDLGNYFEDVDSVLDYSYSSLSHFSIEIDNDIIKFIPEQNWVGYADVVITASDGNYSISSNVFRLIVSDTGNHAPQIISYYPQGITSISQGGTQLFNLSYYDEDGDSLTISWYLNGILVSTGSYYEFENVGEGNYTLIAEINDGTTNSSVSWEFNVVSELDGGLGTGNQTGVCGNGVVDSGEDCDSCSEDVKCTENEICKEGVCTAVKKIPFLIVIIIILLLIISYIFINKKLNYKPPIIKSSELGKAREELSRSEVKTRDIKPLKDYIKEILKKGSMPNNIKEELLKNGWTNEEIKRAFDELK